MSNAKHTPGPWRVISSLVHVVSGSGPDSVVVCRTGFSGSEGDEPKETRERWEADARLIAAAPDLLEALKEARNEIATGGVPSAQDQGPFYGEMIAKFDTAIAKATAAETVGGKS